MAVMILTELHSNLLPKYEFISLRYQQIEIVDLYQGVQTLGILSKFNLLSHQTPSISRYRKTMPEILMPSHGKHDTNV